MKVQEVRTPDWHNHWTKEMKREKHTYVSSFVPKMNSSSCWHAASLHSRRKENSLIRERETREGRLTSSQIDESTVGCHGKRSFQPWGSLSPPPPPFKMHQVCHLRISLDKQDSSEQHLGWPPDTFPSLKSLPTPKSHPDVCVSHPLYQVPWNRHQLSQHAAVSKAFGSEGTNSNTCPCHLMVAR